MRACTIPVLILSTLLSTACVNKAERPPVAIASPDRSQFERCLALAPAVPDLPTYSAFTLPDGRRVVLLDRVRERDVIVARFLVEERTGRLICRASTTYADTWSAEMPAARRSNSGEK